MLVCVVPGPYGFLQLPFHPDALMQDVFERMPEDRQKWIRARYAQELERTRREYYGPPRVPSLCWDVKRGWEAIRS